MGILGVIGLIVVIGSYFGFVTVATFWYWFWMVIVVLDVISQAWEKS